MFGQAIQFLGDALESSKYGFINQTGQALTPGGVYAIDLNRANALSTSVRTALQNLVAVAAGNLAGILLVAEAATAAGDNSQGVVMGYTNALVNGGTASAVNEVQTVAILGTLSAGTYQIVFLDASGNEQQTTPIAFNASVANVQTALDGVSGGANRIVAGGTAQSAMTLTFSGTGYAGKPQPPVEIIPIGVTGVTTITTTRTTHGTPANPGGNPLTRLKAVAGQNYLTACSADIGNVDACVAVQLDTTFAQLTAPGAPTLLASTTGGQLLGGYTLFVKTAWQGAGGVTTPGTEASAAVTAGLTGSVSVTSGSTTPAGATSMIVYVSTAAGQELQVGGVAAGAVGSSPVFIVQQLPPASAPGPQAANTTGTQLCPVFFCGFSFMGSFFNPALT